MAAGEDELEAFIGNRSIVHVLYSSLLLLLKQSLKQGLFARQRAFTSQAVNGLMAGRCQKPGTWIARRAINRPAFKRHQQGVLQRILGQLEISHCADERRKDAPRLASKCLGYHLLR